jgi:hypothetical protein
MSGGVSVDAERLLVIARPVVQQSGAEGKDPFVLSVEVLQCWDCQIQVQLLRDRPLRPRRLRKVIGLLESQAGSARRVVQDEPVLAVGVWGTRDRGLVPLAVSEAQQLTIELGERTRVGAIKDYLPKRRKVHTSLHRSPPTIAMCEANNPEFGRPLPRSRLQAEAAELLARRTPSRAIIWLPNVTPS